jgi:hypothetical protein
MSRERDLARKQCEDLVAVLEVPEPFDLGSLCQRIGHASGRPIVLMPTAMIFGNFCGLWLATSKADYVFYEQHTTPLHQLHIVFHELGHILRGHSASRTLGEDVARALTAAVEPGEVQRVLGRDTYNDDAEYEAELIATLLLQRIGGPATQASQQAADDAESRIERTLRRPGRR